jgi:hypothetical protein
MVALIYIKWSEGRVTFFGYGSKAHHRMAARRAERETSVTSADIKTPVAGPSTGVRSDSDYTSESGKHSDSEDHHVPIYAFDGSAETGLEPSNKGEVGI